MAEGGEDRELRDRRSSEQSLQGLEIDNTSKAEAMKVLQRVLTETLDEQLQREILDLLKALEKNDKNPNELLSQEEKEQFLNVVRDYRRAKPDGLDLIKHLLLQFEIVHRSNFPHATTNTNVAQISSLEENLVYTKNKLQDALDRISVLNSELVQIRQQLRTEQVSFEEQLEHVKTEKRRQQLLFEDEIRALKATIRDLEKDKQELQKQIKELQIQLQENKENLEKYQHDNKMLVENLSEKNLMEIRRNQQEIEDLKTNVTELMEENKRLKTRHPYKLVAYGVTLMTNALYKYVHQPQRLSKNYYSIDTLENDLAARYDGNDDERRNAEKRWRDMKQNIGWTDGSKNLLNQLAEYREKGTKALNVHIEYGEFTEAVRIVFNDNELDQDEMELIRDLFVKCNENLPMQLQQTRTN